MPYFDVKSYWSDAYASSKSSDNYVLGFESRVVEGLAMNEARGHMTRGLFYIKHFLQDNCVNNSDINH